MHACLELFSGIGGFAVAAGHLRWPVSLAIDISQLATDVYRLNFRHDHAVHTIESLRAGRIADLNADVWWMSPPCQPYTRRGNQRDLNDSRSDSLRRVITLVQRLRPPRLAMENVPAFASSHACSRLRHTLRDAGYQLREFNLCPTEFGIPNRRRRYYLVASGDGGLRGPDLQRNDTALSTLLDDAPCPDLYVDAKIVHQYRQTIHCVDANDPAAISSCFTSAYGKSPIRSGSYLREGDRVRRFSPREILRQLGFPESFRMPSSLTTRQAWKLVGNSLSIPVVKHVLSTLPPA